MANDPRWQWLVFSGLTRREQQVLVFLILVIGAGLAYEHYRGGGQRPPLALHRGQPDSRPGQAQSLASRSSPGRQDAWADSVTTAPADGLININEAPAEALETLPGIGPVRAKGIVQYRQAHGPFAQIDDLAQVPGIGEKTLEGLRPYLQPLGPPAAGPKPTADNGVAPTSPSALLRLRMPVAATQPISRININTAPEVELDSLDGIGPVLARRIVEYRLRHGPFRTLDGIQEVPGIGPAILSKNRDRMTVSDPGR